MLNAQCSLNSRHRGCKRECEGQGGLRGAPCLNVTARSQSLERETAHKEQEAREGQGVCEGRKSGRVPVKGREAQGRKPAKGGQPAKGGEQVGSPSPRKA